MICIFRVDASIQMGTGHVMRCLTLAEVLSKQGAKCSFICRDHIGNLIEKIQQSGFQVYKIGPEKNEDLKSKVLPNEKNQLFHSGWLGSTQQQDAQDCLPILEGLQPDWLVVDHYALDKTWEQALKSYYKKLMVIDDLGDRNHLADLLLDQNYGSTFEKYKGLVPERCKVLAGTSFALLRPEFALWREYSLNRRKSNASISNVLVTLGGADPDNYTVKVLQQLASVEWHPQVEIVVVMGSTAPHLKSVQHQAAGMPVKTTVKADVTNMAELMSNTDLAIGAAGATTWERCCLGLPTIQLVIAENQRQIAEDLAKENVVKLLGNIRELTYLIASVEEWLLSTVVHARSVADGLGAERVSKYLIKGL